MWCSRRQLSTSSLRLSLARSTCSLPEHYRSQHKHGVTIMLVLRHAARREIAMQTIHTPSLQIHLHTRQSALQFLECAETHPITDRELFDTLCVRYGEQTQLAGTMPPLTICLLKSPELPEFIQDQRDFLFMQDDNIQVLLAEYDHVTQHVI
jgi:hypothetical protein